VPRNDFGVILIPEDRIASWQRRFPDFDPGGAQLAFAIRSLAQRINDNANEWLAPYGLTATKFTYLATICSEDGEGLTTLELGTLVHTSSGTVTTMVKALERDGFVKRNVNREDARSVRIQATKKGRNLMDKAWSVHHRNIDDMVAGLSERKRTMLLEALVTVGANLNRRANT
jgi:DNA-binding MarR family transcriptional regulator